MCRPATSRSVSVVLGRSAMRPAAYRNGEVRLDGEVYLDYQSAKPVDPRVVEAMMPYFTERFGNPAALHTVGDRATQALEESRAAVAGFIRAQPEEIVFTSGATESNNLSLIHISEPTRRTPISYAVFCLKTKKNKHTKNSN